MAQDITWLGATYEDIPGLTLPKKGGGTALFADPSGVTAEASDVASGKYFLDADGNLVAGTASGGGGSSSWTKVVETEYTASTTATSAQTVATWGTGHSELWTSDKIVYVRVRDTAGKRAGYFYGSDNFFINVVPANGGGSTSLTQGLRATIRYTSSNEYSTTNGMLGGSNGYGVYADNIYNDGRIRIRTRYNSSYSLTIDGTYKVEVYLLDPPSPIFE